MRQPNNYLCVSITDIDYKTITYKNVIGIKEHTYKIYPGQTPGLIEGLKLNQYYYIMGSDSTPNNQHPRYIWDIAIPVTQTKCEALLRAHTRNGKQHQYEALPDVLLASIEKYGQAGYEAWAIARADNSNEDPSWIDVLFAVRRNQKRFHKWYQDIVQAEQDARQTALQNNILEF